MRQRHSIEPHKHYDETAVPSDVLVFSVSIRRITKMRIRSEHRATCARLLRRGKQSSLFPAVLKLPNRGFRKDKENLPGGKPSRLLSEARFEELSPLRQAESPAMLRDCNFATIEGDRSVTFAAKRTHPNDCLQLHEHRNYKLDTRARFSLLQ